MKILVVIVFMSSALSLLNAQGNDGFYKGTEEASVEDLLELHKEFNSNYNSISGYRIQIYKGSGNSALEKGQALMDKFSKDYKNKAVYISFSEPYYRVRVGDYRTRLDAVNFLKEIKSKYPSAFVIKEDIELVVLPTYQKNTSYEQENNSRP